ncbi:MAG: hypothetical protein L0H93_05065 [Nocardioides sp.]|nr:hypothetical protein [Nocardioides sp.]
MLDDVTWQALTVVLTLLAGGWTYYAWQHRGKASAVRGAGITLIPVAAYMTGTLKVVARTADAVGDWAMALVFSPTVWIGFILAGVAVLLFVLGGSMSAREDGGGTPSGSAKKTPKRQKKPLNQGTSDKGAPAIDDDLADIEAILKKRGIN